jgi:hypothetical protein
VAGIVYRLKFVTMEAILVIGDYMQSEQRDRDGYQRPTEASAQIFSFVE